jgi:hypothetical protein
MPGVVPEPSMPQPSGGQPAVFGPQGNGGGSADQPTQRFGPYGEQPTQPTQPYGGYPPAGSGE